MQIARAARLGLKIIAVLVGVILALALTWLGVNLVDENLTPAAKAMLTAPPNPYRPDDNIYVAIMGFEAPSQQSIIEAGKARIETYNDALDSMLVDPDAAVAFSEKPQAEKLTFAGNLSAWQPLTSSIWAIARSNRPAVASMLASNQEFYRRYRTLHLLHGYAETARPSHMAPVGFVPRQVRAMYLADIADRIQTGQPSQRRAALTDLAEDLRLWKSMLQGSGSFLSKMVAASNLHADLLLLGDLVADPSFDLALLDGEQEALLRPFDVADWKIGDALAADMRARAPLYATILLANSPVVGSSARPASWWERQWNRLGVQFFKLHATANLEAERMERLRALIDGDPAHFSQARSEYQRWTHQQPQLVSPHTLYNPLGRILLAIEGPSYDGYALRVYDVAALQRLVFLAYQIRSQGISAASVPSFMKQHPEWATHPIDAQPFRWDPDTRELALVTVGKQPEGRRFRLSLSAVAAG